MSDRMLHNARVVTMALEGVIERGWVRIVGGQVESLGAGEPATIEPGDEAVDLRGRLLLPGLIDAHTHACWAGDRRGEWERRLAGASYLELLEQGGGIMSTVRAVRAASREELTETLVERLGVMLDHGTTAAEVKSGYGLDTETELKMLRAIRDASERWPGVVVPTACIGHAKDPGSTDPVRTAIEATLPAVSAEFPGITVDAYCEQGAWSVDECVALFERAREMGHPIRVHTDQFNALGMVEAAIQLGARSVDHLEATGPESMERIGCAHASGLFAVVLPCSGFHLDDRYANGRALVDAGARVVVATNCNPGSSPCVSLAMAAALAVRKCGLTPAEALRSITCEAADLLGLSGRGRIEVGSAADLVVFGADDERAVTHDFGGNLVEAVMVGGEWVSGEIG